MRQSSLELLAPVAKAPFTALAASLERDTLFRVFETYRSPEHQLQAFARGTTRARPFLSGHQLGLAVDFVPKINGDWTWPETSDPIWATLRQRALAFGLMNDISWDRPHVEHPYLYRVVALLKQGAKSAS
jgi:hypothetical protein